MKSYKFLIICILLISFTSCSDSATDSNSNDNGTKPSINPVYKIVQTGQVYCYNADGVLISADATLIKFLGQILWC